jgi:2-haloacid dehalogenase
MQVVMFDFSRYRILTFDCFGTLIDWESGILGAVKPVLERYGVEADDRTILEAYAQIEAKHEEGDFVDYRMILRFVMTELSLRFGFDANPSELDCLSQSIGGWNPFPDTIDSLRRLRNRFKLAIVSNIDDELFAGTAKRLEVPFDWVITAQQARAYKPSEKTFEYALRKIGRPRDEILHVAQSLYHDIVPARSQGLATVWVNRRAGKKGSGATLAKRSAGLTAVDSPNIGHSVAATAQPDLEVPDLSTLVNLIEQ